MSARDNDSPGTKFAKTLLGAAKVVDNAIVSGGAGIGAGILTAPTAPASAGLLPIAAATLASARADELYGNSHANTLADEWIDSWEPTVAAGADRVIDFVDETYRAIPSFTDLDWGFDDDELAPG